MTERDVCSIAEAKVVQLYGDGHCRAIGIMMGTSRGQVLVKNGDRYHTIQITLDASKHPEVHGNFKPV